MKKIFSHSTVSENVRCNCGKSIKLRLIIIKKRLNIHCYNCYRFHEAKRGHYINMNPRKKRIIKGLPVKSFG